MDISPGLFLKLKTLSIYQIKLYPREILSVAKLTRVLYDDPTIAYQKR